MTPEFITIFAMGIIAGAIATVIGMAIYAIAGREDVPVVTGAHSGDEDEDDWDDDLDDADWIIDSVLMQRGREQGE